MEVMLIRLLLIGIGGGLGSIARYGVAVWGAATFGTTAPVGTFIVNVVGSFLLAFVMHISTATEWISPDVRLGLTSGVLGGFTTYSTFNFETTYFFRTGAWLYGTLNILITVVACLAAGIIGLALARLIAGR